MKKRSLQNRPLTLFATFFILTLSAGCTHDGDGFAGLKTKWQQLKAIWGDDNEGMLASEGFYGPLEEDFIPLHEDDLEVQFAEAAIPQPKETPGTPGSGIPSLDNFRVALADLAKIFQNVYFNTDDHILRRPEYIAVIDRAAAYLKKHPNTYISVGGHCDERASEAYNLSLGTRRGNYLRGLLIQRGVDPNKVHSISFGKEQPIDLAHTPSSWARNRRCEFRIWEKQ